MTRRTALLGAAKADALRPVAERGASGLRRVGLCVDSKPAGLIGPSHERRELVHGGGGHEIEGAFVDFARRAVDREEVALFELELHGFHELSRGLES